MPSGLEKSLVVRNRCLKMSFHRSVSEIMGLLFALEDGEVVLESRRCPWSVGPGEQNVVFDDFTAAKTPPFTLTVKRNFSGASLC